MPAINTAATIVAAARQSAATPKGRPGDLFGVAAIGTGEVTDQLPQTATIYNDATLGRSALLDGINATAGILKAASYDVIEVRPGRTYRATVEMIRVANPADPSGHAVEVRMANLDSNKALVSNVVPGLAGGNALGMQIDGIDILIANGRILRTFTFSRDNADADYTNPASTRYARLEVWAYGGDHQTGIGLTRLEDVTETVALGAVDAGLSAATIDLQENIDAGISMLAAGLTKLDEDFAAADELSANVRARTAQIAILSPVMLGARELQATRITFDLGVIEGYFVDNNLPWHSDGRHENLALLPEVVEIDGQAIVVHEWTFDLRPAAGYDLLTGAAWPASSGVYYPQMVATFTATTATIYRKTGESEAPIYTEWKVELYDVPARNAQVWRTNEVYEARRLSDGSFVRVQKIFFNSEVETAIWPNGAADYSGGKNHGNERLLAPAIWLVDGVEVDPAAALTYTPHRVEMVQSTELLQGGSTLGTAFSAAGAAFAHAHKFSTWDSAGFAIRHVLDWQSDGLRILRAFVGMGTIQRTDSDTPAIQISHTSIRSPFWASAVEDVSVASFAEKNDTADHVIIWGDRYSLSVAATLGWGHPSRNTFVDNRAEMNKVYLAPLYDIVAAGSQYLTATATPLTTRIEMKLDVKGDSA